MRRAFAVLLFSACLLAAGGLSTAGARGSLSDLAFRPHPGAELPLQAKLIDEQGRARPLAGFFYRKPIVLVLPVFAGPGLCAA